MYVSGFLSEQLASYAPTNVATTSCTEEEVFRVLDSEAPDWTMESCMMKVHLSDTEAFLILIMRKAVQSWNLRIIYSP